MHKFVRITLLNFSCWTVYVYVFMYVHMYSVEERLRNVFCIFMADTVSHSFLYYVKTIWTLYLINCMHMLYSYKYSVFLIQPWAWPSSSAITYSSGGWGGRCGGSWRSVMQGDAAQTIRRAWLFAHVAQRAIRILVRLPPMWLVDSFLFQTSLYALL